MGLLPILCYGIFRLISKKISKKEVFINCCVFIVLTATVFVWISNSGIRDYVGQANIAIWDLYTGGMNIEQFIVSVTLRTIIICIVLYCISFVQQGKLLIFSVITLVWLNSTYSAYQKDNMARASNNIQNVNEMISQEVTSDDLYYYVGDGNNAEVKVFYLQLKAPFKTIHVLDAWEDVEKLSDGQYVLANQLTALQGKNFNSFTIINKTDDYVLLKKNNE